MGYTFKHGGHDICLDLPALAAGAAADTSTLYAYRPFFVGTRDAAVETILEASLTFDGALSAVATNNFTVKVQQYRNVAGTYTIINEIDYGQAAAGFAASTATPINLAIAVSAILTNPTGTTLLNGWVLLEGDVIVVRRTSNGTGQASPAFTVQLTRGVKS